MIFLSFCWITGCGSASASAFQMLLPLGAKALPWTNSVAGTVLQTALRIIN